MKTAELLKTLDTIAPAIGSKDIVPIIPCVCFNGSEVFAFDDQVAIVAKAPWKQDEVFSCGVVGQKLIDWLKCITSKDVEIGPDPASKSAQSNLLVKAGRSKLSLPTISSTKFLFTTPKIKSAIELDFNADAHTAMKKVAISMGNDPGHAWRMGVTVFIETAKRVVFFTSENITVARSTAKVKSGKEFVGKAFVLPPRFVALLLDNAGAGTKISWTPEWICAEYANGTRMYSRVLPEVHLKTFTGLFSDVEEHKAKSVPIPTVMSGILYQAEVLIKGADACSDIKISDGKLVLTTSTPHGSARSFATLESKHEDVTAKLIPSLVLKGLEHSQRFIITGGDRMVLYGDRFTQLISLSA